MEHCHKIDECLACGGRDLILTLDLKEQPLANNFQRKPGIYPGIDVFPLAVNRCQDCDHLQLTHAVNPELIYTHYLYVSGTSGTYREYMKWYARFVHETFTAYTQRMGPYTVLDIGCNDGSQLDAFKDLAWSTHGVDPADNLYEISSKKHPVTHAFWGEEAASKYLNSLDVITTQNAFAHIPDPLAYLQLCRDCLRADGKIFISTSQADMVLNGEFDTIYHEHISYYNAESMQALAERAGLYLIDVVKTPIHGTSYIFVLSRHSANSARVENILATESQLHRGSTYSRWQARVEKVLTDLREEIALYRNYGYPIIGYGAAAKGSTLINASGIHLDCIIDDNPLKQGLYCPGTDIPIVGIDYLDHIDKEDSVVFVPLAWNFYAEIKNKILNRRNNENDMFLRYFPEVGVEFR